MDSEAFVELALQTWECSQKELAARIGVSPTQISKWKKGEHMSYDMAEKISQMLDLGQRDPSFVLTAGSLEEATKWERLIKHQARVADDSAETGYDTAPLVDEPDLLCSLTFYTLREMGVDLPKAFPSELDVDYDDAPDDFWEALDKNPYASLISEIYTSFTNVYGFYTAYVVDLLHDDRLDLWGDVGANIDGCLLQLAAAKLDDERVKTLATNFLHFRHRVNKDYENWLNVVKEASFRANIPLRAELLKLVHGGDDDLRQEAERESLGFNAGRLHPDIYMNELLRGMRLIHQVLPAIMEKLGISDFKVDETDFYTK